MDLLLSCSQTPNISIGTAWTIAIPRWALQGEDRRSPQLLNNSHREIAPPSTNKLIAASLFIIRKKFSS
ncbi:hypothetical protein JTE90_006398 [Oedothorax gibbosus]|uniref:Uncharacterized protein n=1 Tax=Oedothorax gibbosus TaxID=931172 RepID=A0AAV6VX71_9ARAC|nr:hypothetical protein JTE90_006398 [Oedothorax gibbosus]